MPNKVTAKAKNLSSNSMIAGLMIVCTLVLVGSFLLSKQLLGDIRFNNKVIGRKNAVNETLGKNVEALPKLEDNFETLKKDGPQPSSVLAALPLEIDYPGLGAQFEVMASLAGARLATISLSTATTTGEVPPQPSGSGLQEVSFRVTAVGSYDSLQKLFTSIEKSQRPIKVQTISISGAEPTVTADMSLVTYWQPRTSVEPGRETLR